MITHNQQLPYNLYYILLHMHNLNNKKNNRNWKNWCYDKKTIHITTPLNTYTIIHTDKAGAAEAYVWRIWFNISQVKMNKLVLYQASWLCTLWNTHKPHSQTPVWFTKCIINEKIPTKLSYFLISNEISLYTETETSTLRVWIPKEKQSDEFYKQKLRLDNKTSVDFFISTYSHY